MNKKINNQENRLTDFLLKNIDQIFKMVFGTELSQGHKKSPQVITQKINNYVFGQKPDGVVIENENSLIYVETQISHIDTHMHYGKCVSYAGNLNLQQSSARNLAVFYISTFFDHFHLIEMLERNKNSRVKIIPIKIQHISKESDNYNLRLELITTVPPEVIETIKEDLCDVGYRVNQKKHLVKVENKFHQILKVFQPSSEVYLANECLISELRGTKKINLNKNFEKIGKFLGRKLSIYHFRSLTKGGIQLCYHIKKSDFKEMLKKQMDILEKYPISISLLRDSLKSQVPSKSNRFTMINSARFNLGIFSVPCLYQINFSGSDLIHEMISVQDVEEILNDLEKREHIIMDKNEIILDLLFKTEFLKDSFKKFEDPVDEIFDLAS